jgi:hypothetical protein
VKISFASRKNAKPRCYDEIRYRTDNSDLHCRKYDYAGRISDTCAESATPLRLLPVPRRLLHYVAGLDLRKENMAVIGRVNESLKTHGNEAIRGYSNVAQDVTHQLSS